MASVGVIGSGEDTFLSQLERARREMREKFKAAHVLLQQREATLLVEFQELEDRFRGVGRTADEMKQLSLSKEHLQNALKGNDNKEILRRSTAPLDEKLKELADLLKKAKEMKSIDFDWDEELECKLNSLGKILVDADKSCSRIVSNYRKKGDPVAVFGVHKRSASRKPGDFAFPQSITIDEESSYIYVIDGGNNRVQVFNKSYEFLFTFSEKMSTPCGICLQQDRIYVTQIRSNCLNIYSRDYKLIKSVGKEGTKELEFKDPCGVAVSTEWNRIYVCENGNDRIQCLNLDFSFNLFISDISGALDVKLLTDEIVVLCASNPCIRIYSSSHQLNRQVVTVGKSNQVRNPTFFCLDHNFNILITDFDAHCVLIFSYAGELIHKFGTEGEEKGNFINPRGITMDSEERIFVVSINSNHCIQIF